MFYKRYNTLKGICKIQIDKWTIFQNNDFERLDFEIKKILISIFQNKIEEKWHLFSHGFAQHSINRHILGTLGAVIVHFLAEEKTLSIKSQ